MERMKTDMIANRVYVGESAYSLRSIDRPGKGWIDTVKECFFKVGVLMSDE